MTQHIPIDTDDEDDEPTHDRLAEINFDTGELTLAADDEWQGEISEEPEPIENTATLTLTDADGEEHEFEVTSFGYEFEDDVVPATITLEPAPEHFEFSTQSPFSIGCGGGSPVPTPDTSYVFENALADAAEDSPLSIVSERDHDRMETELYVEGKRHMGRVVITDEEILDTSSLVDMAHFKVQALEHTVADYNVEYLDGEIDYGVEPPNIGEHAALRCQLDTIERHASPGGITIEYNELQGLTVLSTDEAPHCAVFINNWEIADAESLAELAAEKVEALRNIQP